MNIISARLLTYILWYLKSGHIGIEPGDEHSAHDGDVARVAIYTEGAAAAHVVADELVFLQELKELSTHRPEGGGLYKETDKKIVLAVSIIFFKMLLNTK